MEKRNVETLVEKESEIARATQNKEGFQMAGRDLKKQIPNHRQGALKVWDAASRMPPPRVLDHLITPLCRTVSKGVMRAVSKRRVAEGMGEGEAEEMLMGVVERGGEEGGGIGDEGLAMLLKAAAVMGADSLRVGEQIIAQGVGSSKSLGEGGLRELITCWGAASKNGGIGGGIANGIAILHKWSSSGVNGCEVDADIMLEVCRMRVPTTREKDKGPRTDIKGGKDGPETDDKIGEFEIMFSEMGRAMGAVYSVGGGRIGWRGFEAVMGGCAAAVELG